MIKRRRDLFRPSFVQPYAEATRASRSSCECAFSGLAKSSEWTESSAFVRGLCLLSRVNRELAYIHQRINAVWMHLNLAQTSCSKKINTPSIYTECMENRGVQGN